MTARLAVRAPRRAPSTRSASITTLALLTFVVAAFAPRRAAAQPTDLDKLIPADALVYVVSDGLKPLQASVTEFLDGVMPGQGGAMAGMMFMSMQSQPGMGEVDQGKPIYFSFLSSEKPLFALPLANPADFEALLKTQPGGEKLSVLAGQGYSLVSEGPIDLAALKQGTTPKTPLLQGPVRGFADLPRLFEKYGTRIDEALAMMSAMSGQAATGKSLAMFSELRASASRVDFAVTPSKAGLEIAFSTAPSRDGFLSAIAKSQAPSGAGLEQLLAVVPADSYLAGSISVPAGAYKGFFSLLGAEGDVLQKICACMDKFQAVCTNTTAFAMVPGGVGALTQAVGLTDAAKARALMKESMTDAAFVSSLGSLISPGATLACDMKPGAAPIDGIEYDECRVTLSASATATTEEKALIEKAAKVYSDPMLFAYAPRALVFVSGPNGRQRLEQALAAHKSGAASAPAAKAVPANQSMAIAVNLGGMLKAAASANPEMMAGPAAMLANLPAGKEYVTLTMRPVGGTAEVRLNLAAAALRELAGPMMGMGPR